MKVRKILGFRTRKPGCSLGAVNVKCRCQSETIVLLYITQETFPTHNTHDERGGTEKYCLTPSMCGKFTKHVLRHSCTVESGISEYSPPRTRKKESCKVRDPDKAREREEKPEIKVCYHP